LSKPPGESFARFAFALQLGLLAGAALLGRFRQLARDGARFVRSADPGADRRDGRLGKPCSEVNNFGNGVDGGNRSVGGGPEIYCFGALCIKCRTFMYMPDDFSDQALADKTCAILKKKRVSMKTISERLDISYRIVQNYVNV
jgi:hypothetical protein